MVCPLNGMYSILLLDHPVRFCFSSETCYKGNGATYEGSANVTVSGIPCQKWSTQVRKLFFKVEESFAVK